MLATLAEMDGWAGIKESPKGFSLRLGVGRAALHLHLHNSGVKRVLITSRSGRDEG